MPTAAPRPSATDRRALVRCAARPRTSATRAPPRIRVAIPALRIEPIVSIESPAQSRSRRQKTVVAAPVMAQNEPSESGTQGAVAIEDNDWPIVGKRGHCRIVAVTVGLHRERIARSMSAPRHCKHSGGEPGRYILMLKPRVTNKISKISSSNIFFLEQLRALLTLPFGHSGQ